MVAQMILDHFVWVRVLAPEPNIRPHGQVVKTLPSQGGVRGSIPLGATNFGFWSATVQVADFFYKIVDKCYCILYNTHIQNKAGH